MIHDKLIQARELEAERLPRIPAETLPAYHLSAAVGWLNDPNGFSVYKGEYHLFFQYHPYDTKWGPMHWGHAKSRDLIRWERLPAAMAPDEEYDRDGCYSGSALELEDGRHLLMYTGVRKEPAPDGSERELETQCVAFGDGTDYVKYEGNPVITAADLPAGGSERDFRDPRIWRENGRFYAVVGNRCPDGSGAVLLYESGDALRWQYKGVVAASGNKRGRMWECPDCFRLDGKRVLIVSPQEMRADGLEFIEGNVTLCLIGEDGGDAELLRREHEQTIDYGLDFYAPQTVLTPDGRRVMIAWMQYWNSVDWHPAELPFFGQMTLPRELSVREGRLFQNPVRELEAYRGEPVRYENVPVTAPVELPGVRGRCVDLTVTVRTVDGFRIEAARGEGFGTVIRYAPASHTILVDRSASGFPESVMNTRAFLVRDTGGVLKLRLLLDRYSLEIFVNDGESAASFTLYTPQEADDIRFSSDGSAEIDVEKYDLKLDAIS